jgi:NTP pyrophosphatase (non-canonical NTP hydrolase)
MNQKQFDEITAWQKETFPTATMQSKIAHLKQELEEVLDPDQSFAALRLEFADCLFLLFGAASVAGMSYADIIEAIDHKFERNKNRKWGTPDKDGIVNHIKPPNQ